MRYGFELFFGLAFLWLAFNLVDNQTFLFEEDPCYEDFFDKDSGLRLECRCGLPFGLCRCPSLRRKGVSRTSKNWRRNKRIIARHRLGK